jgi:hypothetical protein
MMTVKGLIERLREFDPDLPVCYELHSEYCLLNAADLKVQDLQPARSDGWVHREHGKTTIRYLVFPGN